MALIKCKECGKEISDTAETCPNCGCRTQKGRTVTEAKFQLVKLIAGAGSFFIGLMVFFANIGKVPSRLDDLGEFFDWVEYADEGWSVFFWMLTGIAMAVCGAITVISLRNELGSGKQKETEIDPELARQSWCCDCGYINSGLNCKCVLCGKERVTEKSHGTVTQKDIPTWQRLEMERETARKKTEEENK